MVSTKSALSLIWLASLAVATPTPTQAVDPAVAARKKLHLGTAIGGALDLPTTVTEAPKATVGVIKAQLQARWAQSITVTVVNSHGSDISTVHVNGAGPTPVGNPGGGRLSNGQSSSFAVGSGWNGNIAINDAQFSDTTGDESLIEGSFVNQGNGYAQGDINISFVNGFSLPIVCRCNENGIAVGCNKNLFQLNSCPNYNGQNSCKNPLRPNVNANQPTDFFRPCFFYAGAYTFPSDNNANQLNQKCPGEQYTCCVGTNC